MGVQTQGKMMADEKEFDMNELVDWNHLMGQEIMETEGRGRVNS